MQSPTILVGDVTNVTYIGTRHVLLEPTTSSSIGRRQEGHHSNKVLQWSSVGAVITIVSACVLILSLFGLLMKWASKHKKQEELAEEPIHDLKGLGGFPRAEMVVRSPDFTSHDDPAPPAYNTRQDVLVDVVDEVENNPRWSPLPIAPNDDDDSFRLEDPPASRLVVNRVASSKSSERTGPIQTRGRKHVLRPIHEDIIIREDYREENSPPISPVVSTGSI